MPTLSFVAVIVAVALQIADAVSFVLNPDLSSFAPPEGIDFHYINLDRSVLRRHHMQQLLNYTGLPAERWPGVTVPVDSADVIEGMRGTPGYPRALSHYSPRVYAGTLGCRRSHESLLHHLLEQGRPGMWHMIFEDDVVFARNLLQNLKPQMQLVPQDWDVLRFDCLRVDFEQADPKFFDVLAPGVWRIHSGDDQHCVPGKRCTFWGGNFATLYKHNALPRVLQAFADQREVLNVDTVLSRAGRPTGPVQSYCLRTGAIDLTGVKSDRRLA